MRATRAPRHARRAAGRSPGFPALEGTTPPVEFTGGWKRPSFAVLWLLSLPLLLLVHGPSSRPLPAKLRRANRQCLSRICFMPVCTTLGVRIRKCTYLRAVTGCGVCQCPPWSLQPSVAAALYEYEGHGVPSRETCTVGSVRPDSRSSGWRLAEVLDNSN